MKTNLIEWILEQFSKSTNLSTSCHFYTNHVCLYAKVQYEWLNNTPTRVISIDSISTDRKEVGKGHFTKLLTELEELATKIGCPVYVNSVMNERLRDFLIARGYSRQSETSYFPSLYKSF